MVPGAGVASYEHIAARVVYPNIVAYCEVVAARVDAEYRGEYLFVGNLGVACKHLGCRHFEACKPVDEVLRDKAAYIVEAGSTLAGRWRDFSDISMYSCTILLGLLLYILALVSAEAPVKSTLYTPSVVSSYRVAWAIAVLSVCGTSWMLVSSDMRLITPLS